MTFGAPEPKRIRKFLGAAILTLVSAGSGVINAYVGGEPISRTAEVIAPGATVMVLIYAWGPLSGLHINPAVTLAFTARRDCPLPGRSMRNLRQEHRVRAAVPP